MKKEIITSYSSTLNRNMTIRVFGEDSAVPFLVFACQDGMSSNWEDFHMEETIGDYIESGRIQLYCVDSVDKESWSDTNGDKMHRAWMQDCFFQYAVNEVVPFIRQKNTSGVAPITTGCSMGATHAVVTFLRAPEQFSGVLAFSGLYDTRSFWGNWMNETLYFNSPVDFVPNMSKNHPYINLYNQKKMILCVGRGRWEDECLTTTARMRDIFRDRGINAWVDLWGFDVDHDWPWWRVQIRYFLPFILGEKPFNANGPY